MAITGNLSKVVELPDEVTKLEHLMILDLRACEHLQKLARDIGLLKSPTFLDLSECCSIKCPKDSPSLRTFKGFVVVEPSELSCSLKDLSSPA